MIYHITKQVNANIRLILDQAAIKGSNASKVVVILKILGQEKLYYEISDDLKEFIIETTNEVTIAGRFAFALLEIQLALSKPLDKIPTPSKIKKSKK